MTVDTAYKEALKDASKNLYTVSPSGEMKCYFHAGQMRAWDSVARIVMVLAGSQSGKTSWGPFWLLREIQSRGPGDYLVAAPSFQLLSLKLFPEFLRLFKDTLRYGKFTGVGGFRGRFVFSDYGARCLFGGNPEHLEESRTTKTQVFFGHAMQPDSLESATVKAAWLDEAGQKQFKLGSYEAVRRRLSIHRGRLLITTTPYTLGWLKDIIFDPWQRLKRQGKKHPYIEVINFKSTENPVFPMQEYEETKLTMPAWRHRMFYDGEFDKPAGAIYEDFDSDRHTCAPFRVPDDWPRYLGLDFGGVHTAGVFLAEGMRDGGDWCHGVVDESPKLFLYREYPERSRWESSTASIHVEKLLKGEPKSLYTGKTILPKAYGGAGSEDQWRDEFRAGGLFVGKPPIKDVEPGIDRVVSCFKEDQLIIFNHCNSVLDDVQNYSRPVDDKGNPTEGIENKEDFHFCDALRYIISHIKGGRRELWVR